jgi:hypothetical protein
MPASRSPSGGSGRRKSAFRQHYPDLPATVRHWGDEVIRLRRELEAKTVEFAATDLLAKEKPPQLMAISELHRQLQHAYANMSKELVYHMTRRQHGSKGRTEGERHSDGQDQDGSGERGERPA